jgi:uncharacterized iron-regulated membrane protein
VKFAVNRNVWVKLHRWAGLGMAVFLVVAGLTGTVLAFYEELEHWLNPHLYRVRPHGAPMSPLALRALAEQHMPQGHIDFVDLHHQPDTSVVFYLQPRTDPETGKPYELAFDQLFVDPYTGQILGTRQWGEFGLDRERLLPFLYRLHFTLALPDPWGRWLFGLTALLWTLDCFVGFYLTLPRKGAQFLRRWKPSWLIKRSGSLYRINFDLHRAAGLWTWPMLLLLAVSSVQFNLYNEVFAPALKVLMPMVEVEDALPKLPQPLAAPDLPWEQALERGRTLLAAHTTREGFTVDRETGLWLNREQGFYAYAVKSSLDIRAKGGRTVVYLSALDGQELGFEHPYMASGNAVVQWLAALHMGRVGGLTYRIVLCATGLIVATLSITGVVIWWKKRQGRRQALARRQRRMGHSAGEPGRRSS